MKDIEKNINTEEIANKLCESYKVYGDLPSVTLDDAGVFLNDTLSLLFPQLAKGNKNSAKSIKPRIDKLANDLYQLILNSAEISEDDCQKHVESFIADLPKLTQEVKHDAQALKDGDPAAHSIHDIVITYPGLYAIASHRIANRFYKMEIPLFPRLISEYSHRLTGVDINPGANIGKSFFLDHATGVVIGETAIIGDNVKIYQGVTLGALKVNKGQKNVKRHPTIEDNVTIYANATILGGDTVIGHDSLIGGNVWLTSSVIPKSRVMYRSSDFSENGLDWTI